MDTQARKCVFFLASPAVQCALAFLHPGNYSKGSFLFFTAIQCCIELVDMLFPIVCNSEQSCTG